MLHVYHIIIADDELTLLAFLQRYISRLRPDVRVTALRDGEEALRVYDEQGADLIISNCRRPRMDGPTLIRCIRDRQDPIPIVMLSGDDGNAQIAQDAGATRFLEANMITLALSAILNEFLPV
jgi:two-component system, NarL family, sensor histidine kinase EvgS